MYFRLEIAREDPDVLGMKALSRVSGIGPVLARKLVFDDGIKTVEQLKQLPELTHHQKIGLKYLEQFELRIPRKEMDQWDVCCSGRLRPHRSSYEFLRVVGYRSASFRSG